MSSLDVTPSAADAPLTDREIEQVKRLFSDPFAIPLEFKAWLIAYLETNPPLLTTSSIFGFRSVISEIVAAGQIASVPVGAMADYAGAADPDVHWMLCDGRSLSTTTYATLFAAIAYGYGGAGASFNIPDFRGRVAVGKGTHVDVDTLGESDGSALANRSPKHKHTVTDPTHTHGASAGRPWATRHTLGSDVDSFVENTGSGSDKHIGTQSIDLASTGITVTPGGTPPDHTPAYLVANKIIYVG